MAMTSLILMLVGLTTMTATAHTTNPYWYQRYPAYPPYCSIPSEMNRRSIPPLRPNVHVGDSRLAHVTAVIRHGARTPWSGQMQCWDNYNEIWDCDLTTFLSPPSPRTVDEEEQNGDSGSSSDAMFLFEKRYDALLFPQENELGGTCQKGQLLLRGYDQELVNGQYLRNAYVFDGSNMEHDITMRLLDLKADIRPYDEPTLRYRSDDDQRTLMSGQVLLRGMFGTEFVQQTKVNYGQSPIIPLHVADRSRDVLNPNHDECPALDDLYETAMASSDFKALNTSTEFRHLYTMIEKELGVKEMTSPLECLMTTICTDRTLPDILDDYERKPTNKTAAKWEASYANNRFERLMKLGTQVEVFPFLHNDATYSKLAMGPLWAEILDKILPIIDRGDRGAARNKLHVISGHDTTLIPLLASLGIWGLDKWPPYASMFLLELHEFIDGRTDKDFYPSYYGFRLVFNGQVLTDQITGCPEGHDICDFGVLRNLLQPFAKRDGRMCEATKTTAQLLGTEASQIVSGSGGVWLYLVTIFMSIAIGFYGAKWKLKRSDRVAIAGIAEMTEFRGGYRDYPTIPSEDDEKPDMRVI
eukprot:CAMPEP_0194217684 /NCGR_PEP_ID=MMETSP0156-20130528/21979_1 /TAXON_ID=33649 /ORGANISM="Thalassionema nitzschioides, Strain L26-B" /LENGTH=583 /DNA_ID=CAMNT_0038946799 /DNA_START=48 /DNA_END=1799 /DNA_ORIENTATION=-